MAETQKKKESVISVGLIWIFIILTAALISTGYFGYRRYEKHYRTGLERELSTIADLKAEELERWRSERIGDARIIYKNAALSDLVARYFINPRDVEARHRIEEWLQQYPEHYEYEQVRLLDSRGETRMSFPSGRPPASTSVRSRLPEILQSGDITIIDFYRHDYDRRIYIAVIIPILDGPAGNRAIGAISLQLDPGKYIYPFIMRWPTLARTAETLLVRREGNDVLFLNELKFLKNSALNLKIPLARTDVPAVQAVLGRTGIVEGPDYRGVQVIADVRGVPGSPWFLVTRMDRSEAFAPAREIALMVAGLVTAMIFGTGAALAFVWRQQKLIFYRERALAAEALRENEARLNKTEEIAQLGSWELDLVNNLLHWSDEAYRILGYHPREFGATYEAFLEAVHPDDRAAVDAAYMGSVRDGKDAYEIEHRVVRKSTGEIRIVHEKCFHVRDESGRIIRSIGMAHDITERKRREEELRKVSHQNELILESAGEGIFGVDLQGNVTFINAVAAQTVGFSREEIMGNNSHMAWHYKKPDGTPYPPEECPIYAAHTEGFIHSGETVFWRKDGTGFPVDFTSRPIYEEGKISGAVVTYRDITERKRLEDTIVHMAHHDPLTGLPNRRLFMDIIEHELAQARRNRRRFALLFLDLDRFKEINDTFGHETGDELLREVSRRLRASIRESDVAARIGGDEFNVILADISRTRDITRISRKIMDSFKRPFVIAEHEFRITASIGISIYPDDSDQVETLHRYADIAMYHAKETGRNAFRFYDPDINVRSIERTSMENMLRRSIDMGELAVHYQPQINIGSGKIVRAEALVRWKHPEKGLLEPEHFISAAEDTGFITAIDDYVLRTACVQVRSWLDSGLPSVCVTVNLSARAFQNPELIGKISGILKDSGIPSGCLNLEITESLAMSNINHTISRLTELEKMGVHAYIDDFGAGYSSLSHLKRLPVQKLKIDRSFVKDINISQDDRAIIQAVTVMAHNMKMSVIAKGVETEEQLSFLRSAQCDEAQGYLFGRPLPPDEFGKLLEERKAA